MKIRWVAISIWIFLGTSFISLVLAGKENTAAPAFLQESETTPYRAVFAQYLAVIPNAADPSLSVDCALSVSNVCSAPEELKLFIGDSSDGAPTSGRITLYLYNLDGTEIQYRTDGNSPGDGLNPDGSLGSGQTWTVRLAEILAAAEGKPEAEIQFRGYGWVLSDFDCLAGTYSNTVFGVGFTQSYEMLPAMGQGGNFGGVIIPK